MPRKPNSICPLCSTEFYRQPNIIKSSSVNYCSRKCLTESQKKIRTCSICKIQFTGRKKFCSKACSNKSRVGIRYTGTQTKNRANRIRRLKEKLLIERGQRCERCSYSQVKILQVHHKVEKSKGGTDNLDNLELLCPNCHAEHHYGG